MRPCNQCRKPVENRVMICDQCKAYNEAHGLKPPKTIRANTEDDVEAPDVEPVYDRSLTQILSAFYLVIMLLGALIGVLIYGGVFGFIAGGVIGLIICGGFLRIVFMGM